MNKSFILDNFNGKAQLPFKALRFLQKHQHAKRFRVDFETTQKLRSLASAHVELWLKIRKFAKPPFPEVFVELDGMPIDTGATADQFSVLWVGNRVVVCKMDGTSLSVCPAYADVSEEGFYTNLFSDEELFETPEERDATFHEVTVAAALLEILWLLMHQPGIVKMRDVKGFQKVVKGKLKPFRAHSVLTIDLAAKDIAKTLTRDGSRGSGVREHEVRGTWVHLNHDRNCAAHDWQKVERKPFEPETYDCPCCGTRRVWRKDHVRGDAFRGNKFHTYEVKDSRLEKAA